MLHQQAVVVQVYLSSKLPREEKKGSNRNSSYRNG